MGLDVAAISKANPVACRGDEDCDDTHYVVGSYRKRRDGLKPGCYVRGEGGRSFGFRAGQYAGYSEWRRHLCLSALGVEPDEVWEHPRRFVAKPFVELIDFPDGVGPVIGPKTSAKLFADFVESARQAKNHFLNLPAVAPPRRGDRREVKAKRHVNQAGFLAAVDLAEELGSIVHVADDDDREWMWKLYRNFRRAFKLAADGGFVGFG